MHPDAVTEQILLHDGLRILTLGIVTPGVGEGDGFDAERPEFAPEMQLHGDSGTWTIPPGMQKAAPGRHQQTLSVGDERAAFGHECRPDVASLQGVDSSKPKLLPLRRTRGADAAKSIGFQSMATMPFPEIANVGAASHIHMSVAGASMILTLPPSKRERAWRTSADGVSRMTVSYSEIVRMIAASSSRTWEVQSFQVSGTAHDMRQAEWDSQSAGIRRRP